MASTKRTTELATVVVLVSGMSILHYITSIGWHHQHIFLRQLYFIPIILAGLWFGFRGGCITSLSITAIYFPYIVISWHNFSPEDFNKIIAIILYNIVAVILGLLVDREKEEHKKLLRAESLAAIGKAVSSIAHDMKTPLIAIGGFTRFVQKKMNNDDPDHEKLEIVVKETQRLEQMVKDMLDFSKPLELDRSASDIHKVIQDSIAMVRETADNKKVKIEQDLTNNLPGFRFDEMRMEQVIINLLLNAIQASPEGEIITVRTARNGDDVKVDVKDCGCGIPKEHKEQIFFPFFTTKKEGTGLGLPIVKKIVEAHTGSLEVVDNPDKGVTFRIVLPAKEEAT